VKKETRSRAQDLGRKRLFLIKTPRGREIASSQREAGDIEILLSRSASSQVQKARKARDRQKMPVHCPFGCKILDPAEDSSAGQDHWGGKVGDLGRRKKPLMRLPSGKSKDKTRTRE